MSAPSLRQTLVHREPLADVYVRDDGSAAIHDFAPRQNPRVLALLGLPVLAVLAYFPLQARYGWELALAGLALSSIGPLIARRLSRIVRGDKRSERVIPAPAAPTK